MGYKEMRDEIIEAGSTLAGHSMNQGQLKRFKEGEGRFGKSNSKSAKAQARHEKEAAYMENYPRMQFERQLRRVLEGTAPREIILYVLQHLSDFETKIDASGKTEVSVFRFETQRPGEEI